MNIYTTRQDAIAHEIIEPLEAGELLGQTPEEAFDVEAIANEVIAYFDGHDPYGFMTLDRAGYYLDAEPESFWAIVEKHAR